MLSRQNLGKLLVSAWDHFDSLRLEPPVITLLSSSESVVTSRWHQFQIQNQMTKQVHAIVILKTPVSLGRLLLEAAQQVPDLDCDNGLNLCDAQSVPGSRQYEGQCISCENFQTVEACQERVWEFFVIPWYNVIWQHLQKEAFWRLLRWKCR